MLFDLLRERQLTVEAFALDGPRAWLHVVDPSGAGMRTADDLLGRWVREVLESPGRPRGAGAARALAGSGWPAALEWLEQRWLEFDDPNALEGLLLAAGRGRVTPGLAREEVVARWLAAADAALAAGDADGRLRAGEFLRALAGLGPRGSDGSDLAARVAADWDRANGAQRNLRLGVLAGMGRAPAELVAKVRAWIAAGAGGPTDAQRYGAVRMLAAVDLARSEPRPRLELTGALRLYELAEREGSLNAFDGWLRCIGAVPPAAWARPDEPRGGSEAMAPSLAARALLWYLDVEGPGPTAQRYLRYLATADLREHEAEVGEVLHVRTLAGGGDELRALFARTAEQGDATAKVDRLALLAGILDDARQAALAESLLAAGGRNPWDVVLVGALLAGPSGELVRPAFDAAVHDDLSRPTVLGPDAPWVRAAERAIDDLRRAGRVGEEKTLQRDLRQLLRGSAHPLLPGLQDDSWPPPPGLEVVPLESLDWRLAP